MSKRVFLLCIPLIVFIKLSSCERNFDRQLTFNRRAFMRFIDEDKLRSYLSSFGGNPSAEESRRHMVYKRASGRVRKLKKVTTTPSPPTSDESSFATEKLSSQQNNKNFTVSPRHIVKFELEDAKYSEDYEKLKKSRKLRVKRSSVDSRDDSKKNATGGIRMEKFITKDTFMQPKELFRFLYSDAVIKSPDTYNEKKSTEERKSKREVNSSDSVTSDTRKIKITHPLSTSTRVKHVSFDELSSKMQKTIESALSDAVERGKASEGDYLKFYYGDKIIKVPVTMTKYIASKAKESPAPTKSSIIDSYGKKTVKFLKDDDELPQLLGTKNSYQKFQPSFKYENHNVFLPTTTTERAESYVNFKTPNENFNLKVENDISYLPPKKSVYFYSTNEDSLSSPVKSTSLSSPGPVVFQSTTPSTVMPKSIHIVHPTSNKISNDFIRDTIPITEEINESHNFYSPLHTSIISDNDYKKHLPAPTSYMEYDDGSYTGKEDEKNYEFGYHISDYKTGNNFGHTQVKNKNAITGEYSILLPDGRIQMTKYFADDSGFHADVSYQNTH